MTTFPAAGKIQNNFFKERVFPHCGKLRHEVVVGPQHGVDVSIVNLPNGLAMAMTSDPLSLIPTLGLRESAWLSVQLMANDMATTGFAPMYAQFVLNLPVSLGADDFELYWKYISDYCNKLGVAITGGHTGTFEGMNATVSGGGTMITVAPGEEIITSKGAQKDDVIILTKECALISTAILALSFPEAVKAHCGNDIYLQGCDLFYNTSAVEAGLIAGEIGRHTHGISAMHDVTEGGVLGALYELTHASGCGLHIEESLIPVGVTQEKICSYFQIDPRFCVGAGAMVITAKRKYAEVLLKQLHGGNIPATIIGKVVGADEGMVLIDGSSQKQFTPMNTDPYWNAFFNAVNQGLR